jgi:hypothetical protein
MIPALWDELRACFAIDDPRVLLLLCVTAFIAAVAMAKFRLDHGGIFDGDDDESGEAQGKGGTTSNVHDGEGLAERNGRYGNDDALRDEARP